MYIAVVVHTTEIPFHSRSIMGVNSQLLVFFSFASFASIFKYFLRPYTYLFNFINIIIKGLVSPIYALLASGNFFLLWIFWQINLLNLLRFAGQICQICQISKFSRFQQTLANSGNIFAKKMPCVNEWCFKNSKLIERWFYNSDFLFEIFIKFFVSSLEWPVTIHSL